MPTSDDPPLDAAGITVRPQEQLLIDALDALDAPPRRVLCTSRGFAQLAVAAARLFPDAKVVCHWLDLYRADAARAQVGNEGDSPIFAATMRNKRSEQLPAKIWTVHENLAMVCSPDFPHDKIELAALPLSAQGEAELTRELLQEAHDRLALGGLLLASTDNPRDRWLHGELDTLFGSVSRREHATGAVYQVRKSAPLARRRNFTCELAFRDRTRLIHLRTRPGVFSHRRIDPGARQLMAAMEIRPGNRVLDMGCGSGAVSLAAAFRADGATVVAVDSHARAVECTSWGVHRNGLANVAVEHSATGPSEMSESFDVVLANPPYFAELRIARFFLETARAGLRQGGRIYVVSKQPQWYAEHMPQWFDDVAVDRSKDYWIARGQR